MFQEVVLLFSGGAGNCWHFYPAVLSWRSTIVTAQKIIKNLRSSHILPQLVLHANSGFQSRSWGIWLEPSLWPGSGSSFSFSFIIHVFSRAKNKLVMYCIQLLPVLFILYTLLTLQKRMFKKKFSEPERAPGIKSRSRSWPETGRLRNPACHDSTHLVFDFCKQKLILFIFTFYLRLL